MYFLCSDGETRLFILDNDLAIGVKEVHTDVTSIVTVVSFLGGIAIYIFKKIVIEPLRKAIESLSESIKEFKDTAEKRMDLLEKRVDIVEDKSTRHEEQIKSIFNNLEGRWGK